MTMAQIQTKSPAYPDSGSGFTLAEHARLATSPNSHILVRLAADREPNDSGRMTICHGTDIPDLMDYSEWRGR
jgi:hypothetical protein